MRGAMVLMSAIQVQIWSLFTIFLLNTYIYLKTSGKAVTVAFHLKNKEKDPSVLGKRPTWAL